MASQFIDGYNQKGGNGGTGATSTITGASEEYAGGGGGGINDDPNNTSVNGPGFGSAGGGNGAGASTAATDADPNSGSGGGGGANLLVRKAGGAGGSGIVVVRYQGDPAATGGNPTAGTGTAAGYTVHEFLATGDSTLDFSGTDMNTRLGATLTSGITGTGNLTFSGPGTLTLNAANGYTGATSISAGTLAIGAAGSIANTSGVAIASGATFDVSAASGFAIGSSQTLSGVGTVAGAISIAGTHSPGTSPGLQTFDSNLTYSSGANVDWELIANSQGSAGTDYDQIAVGGNLDFAGTTTLDLIFNTGGSGVAWSNTFWDNDRAWLVWDLSTGSISNLGNLSINTVDWLDGSGTAFSTARPDASFSISQVGQDVSLVYTAVPEPGVLAMLPAAGLALVGLRRFRRRLKRKTTTRPLLWSPEPCLQSENTCRVALVSPRQEVNAMKSLNICIVALAVTLSWAAPLAAGPVFVVVGSDNTSLLTVELQNGKAVITNTQSLTPSVGVSTFPVITYADDPANPFSVYALRNDQIAIIEANATDGAWNDGGYGVLSGVSFDDIAYDGGQSQMYGTAVNGGELWRINGPSSSTRVGIFPAGFFQEITIDEATGQMYGTDLNGQALYTIDKTNATWSQISGFTAAGTGTAGSFTDLTFTLDGQLYGMNTTAIFEIDKATAVYNPTFFPIEDSSGNPVTVSGHFAAVPEPATFILTAIAVGAAAGVRLRQRLAAAGAG
ncbi:MAG: autotransporter-associated beta strand repeat-containing protein [Planctomycetota bacterium]|nr:autotransporter-associated beta strand repeat-containing protein [Planctomycetota bacterium]